MIMQPSATDRGRRDPDAAGRRLRWQCRRGMLELDLLLLGFLDKGYEDLSPAGCNAFEALLGSPDQLLYEYLLGGTVPIDKEVADVVRRIRAAAGP